MAIDFASLTKIEPLKGLIARTPDGKMGVAPLAASGVQYADGKDAETKHNDLATLVSQLQATLNTFLNGEADGGDLDRLIELVAEIRSGKDSIDALVADKVAKADIIDDLTTGGADKVLSAEQGKALKALIDELSATVNSTKLCAQVVSELPESNEWPSTVRDDGVLFYIPASTAAEGGEVTA